MVSNQSLTFDDLEDLLATAGSEMQGAELQGLFCGLFAGGAAAEPDHWHEFLLEELTKGEPLDGEIFEVLVSYAKQLSHLLHHELFALELALPDDNASVTERLAAVSSWCRGFLSGYGSALGQQVTRPSSDSASQQQTELEEALGDLVEISQVALEVDEDEDSEQALMTVIEHVKVTAQIVFIEQVGTKQDESNGSSDSNDTADQPPTIH